MKRAGIVCFTLFTLGTLAWTAAVLSSPTHTPETPVDSDPVSVIIQGADAASVAAAVRAVGGEITHELGIIRAVAARLNA